MERSRSALTRSRTSFTRSDSAGRAALLSAARRVRPYRSCMRLVFAAYVVVIAVGLIAYVVIGLTHN